MEGGCICLEDFPVGIPPENSRVKEHFCTHLKTNAEKQHQTSRIALIIVFPSGLKLCTAVDQHVRTKYAD